MAVATASPAASHGLADHLVAGDPDGRGENVPADEIPQLGKRTVDSTKDEHGRRTESTYDHQQVRALQTLVIDGGVQ